jgi:hypothetical protein
MLHTLALVITRALQAGGAIVVVGIVAYGLWSSLTGLPSP